MNLEIVIQEIPGDISPEELDSINLHVKEISGKEIKPTPDLEYLSFEVLPEKRKISISKKNNLNGQEEKKIIYKVRDYNSKIDPCFLTYIAEGIFEYPL